MMKQLAVGTKIARFEVQEEVGRGGMGVVYRCFDPVLKRSIALKLLASHLGQNTTALTRFQREATLVASLKHAHIAIVYDFGQHEQQPYMALEWIEGQTLKELLQQPEPLSLERCLHFFDQLASALDYAHQRGVIHRDLKPANIIIGPDDLVTIVDFGIAWLDAEPSITTTGSVVGTPLYMSPEQIQGKKLDGRSDLYSLAVILYQMLAGQVPFDSDTPAALFQQLIHAPPPPISEHNPTLPPAIELALNKALAKNPDERFPDGASMGQVLRGLTKLPPTQGKKRRLLPLILATGILFWLAMMYMMLSGSYLSTSNEANNEANSVLSPTEPVLVNNQDEQSPINEQEQEAEGTLDDEEMGYEEGFAWLMAGGTPSHSRFVDIPFPQFESEPHWYSEIESTWDLVGTSEHLIIGQALEIGALNSQNGEEVQEPLFLGAEIAGSPLLYLDGEDSFIIVPAEEGQLYAFNLTSGRFRWHLGADELRGSLPGGITSDYNEKFYAATNRGYVYGLGLFDKEIFWSLDLSEQDRFIQPPSTANGLLFLASETGALLAIDLGRQDIVWREQIGGVPLTPPVLIEESGIVMVGTDEGMVQAFSMISGEEVWNQRAESEVFGLAVDWEQVYVVTRDQELIVLGREEGEFRWNKRFEHPIVAPPITDGNFVVVSTEEGSIHFVLTYQEEANEVDEADILPEYKLSVDSEVSGSPLPIGRWLVVPTFDGIYGFSPQEDSK